jgi:hypothetical protein
MIFCKQITTNVIENNVTFHFLFLLLCKAWHLNFSHQRIHANFMKFASIIKQISLSRLLALLSSTKSVRAHFLACLRVQKAFSSRDRYSLLAGKALNRRKRMKF